MTKTRIFSISLIPIILFLGWLLYDGIASKIRLAEAISADEQKVIEKLKLIRDAEKAYLAKYDTYTGSFDTLINFIKHDSLYITEKTEIITPRDRRDPLFYKGDSIRIEVDTIGIEPVVTSVFEEKYKKYNWDKLSIVPRYANDPSNQDKKFEIYSDKVEKSGVMIDVIEVVDKYPLDESRSDKNEIPKRKFLRFGSRSEVTTSGNWE
ncbi:hypothetical protein [Chondrinema litorale]|uniref:hypothetical protein n=1 Tax=Chondrinema litorale TaxID=2994555 RepID=UPI002543899D|nr:hypothetical protein [Chondrinema litorale]UZR95158.1 hypothetical protein OQ292_04920 [Chondrinema litorale]